MLATTTAPPNGFTVAAAGMKLLGEIISWTCPGVAVRHADVVTALTDAGLDVSVARQLLPRHAFARACQKLRKGRLIRSVAEDAEAITFQFTHEARAGDKYE